MSVLQGFTGLGVEGLLWAKARPFVGLRSADLLFWVGDFYSLACS